MTALLKQEGLPEANDPSTRDIYFRHAHHLRQAHKKSKQAAKEDCTFLAGGAGNAITGTRNQTGFLARLLARTG